MLDLEALFEKHENEHIKFERVQSPAHPRPDVCAFLLLHELSPSVTGLDMVASAEHDQIWLHADPEEVAKNATEEQIVTLIRCGVMYDSEMESFSMFA